MVKIKYTKETFIEKANSIHGNYDYSNSNYVNITTKIEIVCPLHGVFVQKPSNHLTGQGCPVCGREQANKKIALSQEDFIKRVKDIHGDLYDLSLVHYINNRTKVKVICKTHGPFMMSPENLMNGMHCKKCSSSYLRISETEFVDKINHLLGDKLDIVSGTYSGMNNPVKFNCFIHGEFQKNRAIDALKSKCLCPKCSRGGHGQYNITKVIRGDFDNINGILYLLSIKNNEFDVLKIGVAKEVSLNTRILKLKNELSDFSVSIIDTYKSDLSECILFEQKLHDVFSKQKVYLGLDFGGKSEIFDSSILKTGEGLTNLLEDYCK